MSVNWCTNEVDLERFSTGCFGYVELKTDSTSYPFHPLEALTQPLVSPSLFRVYNPLLCFGIFLISPLFDLLTDTYRK